MKLSETWIADVRTVCALLYDLLPLIIENAGSYVAAAATLFVISTLQACANWFSTECDREDSQEERYVAHLPSMYMYMYVHGHGQFEMCAHTRCSRNLSAN